ncbi:transglutaminase family protein [Craurococcus roseus]|uniref:Transglutaminase family protein n=1 Tax=Craurococcus roseus TaxID=77585 RepID=A0ABN1FFA7_9PROT
MPLLAVRHTTTYRYRQPVAFGEHRMMLRPREGHDQRILDARLDISPAPSGVRWLHDVFGNSVAVARFSGRAAELRFDSYVRLDHQPSGADDLHLDEHGAIWPFSYGPEEGADLGRSIERHFPDPEREVDRWARRFARAGGPTDTLELLSEMTHAIRNEFAYVAREGGGTQPPGRTLKLGSGTCRDFAVLMMEAVRSLGFAARFVSGYLYSPGRDGDGHVGGGSTHAWVRVYLPGAGWVEFDPTNGIVGNRDLIRVAVARQASQAVPLAGSWTGFPADSLGMEVEVHVTSAEPGGVGDAAPGAAAEHAAPPSPAASDAALV